MRHQNGVPLRATDKRMTSDDRGIGNGHDKDVTFNPPGPGENIGLVGSPHCERVTTVWPDRHRAEIITGPGTNQLPAERSFMPAA